MNKGFRHSARTQRACVLTDSYYTSGVQNRKYFDIFVTLCEINRIIILEYVYPYVNKQKP
jgi:hypothetical protein